MNPFSKNYQSQLDLSDIKADTKMSEVRAKARKAKMESADPEVRKAARGDIGPLSKRKRKVRPT